MATYIVQAELSPSTVALAACILDTLSSSFVRSWRKDCEKARSSETATFRSKPLKPELIILGAFVLAHGYLHDVSGQPEWWCRVANGTRKPHENGTIMRREITATTRCILQDIDYGLMSFTPGDVELKEQEIFGKGEGGSHNGNAVFSQGQLTPDLLAE